MSSLPSITLDVKLFNAGLYRRIHRLWFSDLPLPASAATSAQTRRWFGAPEVRATFDKECFETGNEALQSIGPKNLRLSPDPKEDAAIAAAFASLLTQTEELRPEEVALSLAILLDQLPRNCYRTSQKDVYSHYDRISRAVYHEIASRGLDTSERYRDSPPWRLWFYMALMHSESLKDHRIFEDTLKDMKDGAEERGDAAAAGYIDTTRGFMVKHTAILEKFGRYPHRNECLGRETNEEEKAWLENGGDTFGT
ncbi:MAG: hypothetical protein Q9191_000821 [Dirinaria sp. TL-2023a]